MAREYRDEFAYDLSKDVLTKGEIYDVDVINQSIEMILTTKKGERVFNPFYGSVLPLVIFENITTRNGDAVLDQVIKDIEEWEDRITIDPQRAKLSIKPDENSLRLTIPYTINKNGITSSFDKKVLL